jgi:hypothetical protein
MSSDNHEQPASAADIQKVRTALENTLEKLHAELLALRGQLTPQEGKEDQLQPERTSAELPQDLVTLDQMAAMVRRCKRSLERYRKQLPPPRFRGRRGQPHLWDWTEVRPWLEETFGLRLPEHFPSIPR